MAARNAEVVIINCSTRGLTALALLSALRHGDLPVTVIDCASTDGSGFLHAGEWLTSNHLRGHQRGYYAPRMWIPCVMLDVATIRSALAAGISFLQRVICNEVPQLPWLSQLLHLRLRVPGLRGMSLAPAPARVGALHGR